MVPSQRFCMGKVCNFYGVEPCWRKDTVGDGLWEIIASPHFWFFLCFLCATEMWSLSFLVLLPCLSCHYQLRNRIFLSSSCFWFWCSITATKRQTTILLTVVLSHPYPNTGVGWRKCRKSNHPPSLWGLLYQVLIKAFPTNHLFTLKIPWEVTSTNPISQGMQLGRRAEKLLHVPWGVVGLECVLESPRPTFSLPWWPTKFSVNNKQIRISFTYYMPNYISINCFWLLESCHRTREQQLESHVRKISCGSLSINVLLPKTWFHKVEKALNSTWLSRQCPTFAKKVLKCHSSAWSYMPSGAQGNTKGRFQEAVTLQQQEPA